MLEAHADAFAAVLLERESIFRFLLRPAQQAPHARKHGFDSRTLHSTQRWPNGKAPDF